MDRCYDQWWTRAIQNHQMVYDSPLPKYCSLYRHHVPLDGVNWTTLINRLSHVVEHNMVFDKARGAVLTCGFEGSTRSNDVWVVQRRVEPTINK